MSSEDVKLSTGRSRKHHRTAGDAPALGRIARMPPVVMEKEDGRRLTALTRAKSRVIVYWSVTICVGAIALIASAFYFWLSPLMEERAMQAVKLRAMEALEGNTKVASKFPSPSENEAIDLVKTALAARKPDRIEALFRQGTATVKDISDFLGKLTTLDGPIHQYEWLSSIDANHVQIDGVLIHSIKDGKPKDRIAFLTPDETGVWKVDFNSFARTVSPSWQDLLHKGADRGVVRVLLGKDTYFNGRFSDDSEWVCYGLSSPDIEVPPFGYCKVGSPQAAALQSITSKQGYIIRATLELRRVKGALATQFEITKVLAEDWVLSPEPYEEGFR